MKATLFNQQWKFWEITNSFALNWAPPADARILDLPHDAMIEVPQDPDAKAGANTGYRKGGIYSYAKTLFADSADKTYLLKIEGAYMNAFVYVNGQLACKRPFGYTVFYVPLNKYLEYGKENEIRIQVRSGAEPNSRWYPGTGLYRDVYLLEAGKQYIKPDSVEIRTLRIPSEDQMKPQLELGDGGFEGSAGVFHLKLSGTANPLSAGKGAEVQIRALIANHTEEKNGTLEAAIRDPFGHVVATGQVALDDIAICDESATALACCPVMHILDSPEDLDHALYPTELSVDIPQPLLWSAETPYLYTCSLTLKSPVGNVLDTHEETFGIRILSLSAREGFRVNGQEVKLRGACIHHDSGILGAKTYEDVHIRQISKLKEAGFNAIRSAHNPAAPALLRACDQVGMYVMDETFDIWTRHKTDYDYGMYFEEWWEADVEAMVRNDFNHPSVIMYSIGNEIPEIGTPQGGRLTQMLCETIRSLDDTRFTLASVNGIFAVGDQLDQIVHDVAAGIQADGKDAGNVNDFMAFTHQYMDEMTCHPIVDQVISVPFSHTDIAGYNYMNGRYELDSNLHPDRVIVGSETGIINIAENWNMVLAHPYLIGDFCWTGWEYLGEAGIGMPGYSGSGDPFGKAAFPLQISGTGAIDITGRRLPMSYYREIIFGLRKDPYIAIQDPAHYGDELIRNPWIISDAIGSWSWSAYTGKPVVAEVYCGSNEVELLKNGVSLGRKPAGASAGYMACFETTYEPGTLTAIAYQDGAPVGKWELSTASDDLQLVLEQDPAYRELIRLSTPEPVVPEKEPGIFDSVIAQISAQAPSAPSPVFPSGQMGSPAAPDGQNASVSNPVPSAEGPEPDPEKGPLFRIRFLTIRLADKQGITASDKEAILHYQVDGEAEVLGFGSADPLPSYNYDSKETKTYQGLAQLILKVPEGNAPVTVTLTAEGVQAEPLTASIEF